MVEQKEARIELVRPIFAVNNRLRSFLPNGAPQHEKSGGQVRFLDDQIPADIRTQENQILCFAQNDNRGAGRQRSKRRIRLS